MFNPNRCWLHGLCQNKRVWTAGTFFLVTCFVPLVQARAQVAPTTSTINSSRSVPPVNKDILPPERLGGDDLIEIMVSYCPELSRTFRISSDGTLSLPLIHKKLVVAGLTPIQATRLVEQALQEENILAEPTVNISVLEYRSRPVSVVGAVNHPLTFQATGQTTLLDAIAKAGGLGPTAGGNIIVTTMSQGAAGSMQDKPLRLIPVKDLISGSDPSLNMKIQGNEEIRVPEAMKIFVAGNVRHPGMYPMQGDTDTTVIKAIALSEGLDAYSSANAFIYRRRATGAERDEVRIPLSKILSHKSPDIALLADDILYIPTNNGKRMTSKILNQIAGFGQTAGAALVYK